MFKKLLLLMTLLIIPVGIGNAVEEIPSDTPSLLAMKNREVVDNAVKELRIDFTKFLTEHKNIFISSQYGVNQVFLEAVRYGYLDSVQEFLTSPDIAYKPDQESIDIAPWIAHYDKYEGILKLLLTPHRGVPLLGQLGVDGAFNMAFGRRNKVKLNILRLLFTPRPGVPLPKEENIIKAYRKVNNSNYSDFITDTHALLAPYVPEGVRQETQKEYMP